MARDGFFTDNLRRSYPFVLGEEAGAGKGGSSMSLPEGAVADAVFLLSPLVDFDPAGDRVELAEVLRDADGLTFRLRFRCTASAEALEFPVPSDAALFDVVAVRGDEWEGFLTVGKVAELAAAVPAGQALTPGDAVPVVEPCAVIHQAASVRRVRLANFDRTRHTPPPGCAGSSSIAASSSSSAGATTDGLYARDDVFTGDVAFADGYNLTVKQGEGAIALEAGVGAGAGEPCEEVRIAGWEDPPEGSTTLDGGLRCGEVVSTVNGVSGRSLTLQAGQGVRIYPGEAANELVVDIDLSGMAVCTAAGGSSSSSSTNSSTGGG